MKHVLVTGANKGIGLAIVRAVLQAADDTAVVLGSRDAARGEAARQEVITQRPAWASRLDTVTLDVSNAASVEEAARVVADRHGALFGLVNNAGINGDRSDLDRVLEVNTRGPRRVCNALLPLVTSGGRVVNISSAAGPNFVSACSPDRQRMFTDPAVTWPQVEALIQECLDIEAAGGDFAAAGLGSGNAYGLSKACLNAYTRSLARAHPQLVVNACTPGFIETDMTRPYAEGSGRSATDMGMLPPSSGTRAPLFLLLGDVEGTGMYYGSDALRSPFDRYRSPGDPPYTGH